MKNVLTTSTAGAQASTHGPKLENAARPALSRPPTATTLGRAAGKNGRHEPLLPAEATTTAVAEQAPDRVGHRRRRVVGGEGAEAHHDDVDGLLAASRLGRRAFDGGDHRDVVAVAEARQHAAVRGCAASGQIWRTMPADERAVPGLVVELAALVVIGLVLVVPRPDVLAIGATRRGRRRSLERGVLDVGPAGEPGAQPRVEHEHVRAAVLGQAERPGQHGRVGGAGGRQQVGGIDRVAEHAGSRPGCRSRRGCR